MHAAEIDHGREIMFVGQRRVTIEQRSPPARPTGEFIRSSLLPTTGDHT